jgi:hypothetical protein
MCLQTHVADFVEEQRPAVRSLKFPFFIGDGCGKRAPAMTKKLAFDQILGNRRTVDFHKHFFLSRALDMDGARHQFFAGSLFSVNQHPTIGRSHELDLLAERFHGNAVAGDYALGS